MLVPAPLDARSPQPAITKLQITVLEGEGAVNIIQQATAVAPLLEVRDQNGLPVPGVSVVFRIARGGATFPGGSSTLSVTTNAAGRAVAAGLTPGTPGAVQISATASFQGQTAAVTISQSNFATAAAAAAGAAGGGIGATTLAVIAGALGGGAAIAVKAKSSDVPGGSATAGTPGATTPPTTTTTPPTTATPPGTTPPPSTTPPQEAVYNGTFSGTYTSVATSASFGGCTTRFSVNGSMSVSAELRGDAVTSGNFLELVLQFQQIAKCVDRVGRIGEIPGTMESFIMRPILNISIGDGPFSLETNGPVTGGGSWNFAQERSEMDTATGGQAGTVTTTLRRAIDVTGQLTRDGGSAVLLLTHRTHMTWTSDPGDFNTADGSGRFSFALNRIR